METLKFAVIGTGRFGKHYVRLVSEIPETELVKTADSSSNLEELLASDEIECVIIATPAVTHFDIAKQALRAGKHVLLEKPMVLSVAAAEELRKTVKQSGKVFMVGHQYFYNDHIRYLKNQIESGALGDVTSVSGKHLYPGPVREDIGVFWDAAPHELSVVDYLFGPIGTVGARGSAGTQEGHVHDDTVQVTIEFQSSPELHLDLSSVAPEKIRQIEFTGTKATAFYDDLADEQRLKIEGKVQTVEAHEPLRNQLDHFVDCIKNNKVPFTDVEHGVRVVRALESVGESIGITLK